MDTTKQYKEVLGNAMVAGPASDAMILEAEHKLGVEFPEPYKKFLKNFGGGFVGGFEMAGLCVSANDAPPDCDDIVKETLESRKSWGDELPKSYLPIAHDGVEWTFYIDASGPPECPVFVYGPGAEGKKVSDSFEEFVIRIPKDDFDI